MDIGALSVGSTQQRLPRAGGADGDRKAVSAAASFLAECYGSGTSKGWLRDAWASADETGRDRGVRCADAILIPEDGVALFFIDAASCGVVNDVLRAAGIPVDRIVEFVRA